MSKINPNEPAMPGIATEPYTTTVKIPDETNSSGHQSEQHTLLNEIYKPGLTIRQELAFGFCRELIKRYSLKGAFETAVEGDFDLIDGAIEWGFHLADRFIKVNNEQEENND